MEPNVWKSQRKIEEEMKVYRSKRFEDYMCMADRGVVERAIAISALREEISYEETGAQVGSETTKQDHKVS
jgi:hypothetical protein